MKLKSSSLPTRSKSVWIQIALVLILLLAFGLRVYRLGSQGLWADEMQTSALARFPFGVMFETLLSHRVHVPLYFLVMRLWVWVGTAEFALRFFSLVWGVAAVALVYRLGKEMAQEGAGLIAALLLAASPFHIWFSQEARMYTLVATSVLAASVFLVRLLRRDAWTDWVGYGACMLVAVYTHYLAVLVLVAHYVLFSLHYRLLRPIFAKWLVTAGLVGALFSVWFALILITGGFTQSAIAWIAPAHWYEPVLTLSAFSGASSSDLSQPSVYLPSVVSLSALGLVVLSLRRVRPPVNAPVGMLPEPASPEQIGYHLQPRLLLAWLFVPLLLTWLISLDLPVPNKRSIYMDRYLIIVMPAFVALVGIGLWTLYRRWRGAALAMLAIAVAGNALALRNMYVEPAYAREDWRAAMYYLRDGREPDDILILRPSQTLPLAYYGDPSWPYEEFPFLFLEEERQTFLDTEMPERMTAIAREWDRAWLVTSVDNINPHGFPEARNDALARAHESDAIKGWLDAHYTMLSEVRFTGIRLTLYDLRKAQERANEGRYRASRAGSFQFRGPCSEEQGGPSEGCTMAHSTTPGKMS